MSDMKISVGFRRETGVYRIVYALRQTGAPLATTLMIGDNPDTDITGARTAGLPTIYFNRTGRPATVPCTYEVTSLDAIQSLL